MTDNNAALSALDFLDEQRPSRGEPEATANAFKTIRTALSSPSPAVDVSSVRAWQEHLEKHVEGSDTDRAIAMDVVITGMKEALQSLTAMREAWLPIESAPRDGTLFLGLSKFYKDPFVTYWGSAAQERGDIPALPEGSSIQQHWVLANSEDGSVLYEPDYWMPLKCSEPPKGEKS